MESEDAGPENLEPASGEPVGPWSTFEATPADWPEDLVTELARWKQGHVVADVPVTWVAPPGEDLVTSLDITGAVAGPVKNDDLQAGFVMICSQTCDIGTDSAPGMYHPFVLVAPLVPLSQISDAKVRNLAKEGKVGWLVPTLKPDPASAEDQWFCDLRLMVPLSKSMLVGKDPVNGFADELSHLRFAEAIAQKFRRPALSATLSEDLPKVLRKFIQDQGTKKSAFRKVEQVRLSIIDSERLFPARGQLIVLMNSPLSDEEQALWREVEMKVDKLFTDAGIMMIPLTFSDVDRMPARTYRVTVPLHLDVLAFPSYP